MHSQAQRHLVLNTNDEGTCKEEMIIVSSFTLRMTQTLGPCQFFFIRLSHVWIALLTTS